MNQDLKLIKKHYGEKMMHLCRELFSTILDNSPGTLSQILLDNFNPSHFLYDDIIENYYETRFKDYIYSIYDDMQKTDELPDINVSNPATLMRQAGYTLYECTCEEDIQKFKKYYAHREELCTFNGGRLEHCYVYFAIHDNAETLNRQDFLHPDRQDEYGTSVISIQFTSNENHTLSIKNRYNHTVANPDATFSNNLDNIIPGLTKSFADYYGMIQKNVPSDDFELPGYVMADNGKFYKYNHEINNIYYCPDNIIINNLQVSHLPKEKYLLVDYFIIDLVNKMITSRVTDESFPYTISKIKNITIKNDGEIKVVTIIPQIGEDIILVLDKYSRIISLKNHNLKNVPNNFLHYINEIKNIYLDNVVKIGNSFLERAYNLESLSLPKVTEVGKWCLSNANSIMIVNLPLLEKIGDRFMFTAYSLETLELPNVKIIGNYCFTVVNKLQKLVLPQVISIGADMIAGETPKLEMLFLPEVKTVDHQFCSQCYNLKEVTLPKLKSVGDYFLSNCIQITEIDLPQVEFVGNMFGYNCKNVKEVLLPNVKKIGMDFLRTNNQVTKVNLPRVEVIGKCFMKLNTTVREVILTNVKKIGVNFLDNNDYIELFYAPNLVLEDNPPKPKEKKTVEKIKKLIK